MTPANRRLQDRIEILGEADAVHSKRSSAA